MIPPEGGVFSEASIEFNEGRQSVPPSEFTGQYFKCYRGDMRDITVTDKNFTVIDEKERRWTCIATSRDESESGGFAEMLSQMGGPPSTEPLRLVILHCENQMELRTKLSDEID